MTQVLQEEDSSFSLTPLPNNWTLFHQCSCIDALGKCEWISFSQMSLSMLEGWTLPGQWKSGSLWELSKCWIIPLPSHLWRSAMACLLFSTPLRQCAPQPTIPFSLTSHTRLCRCQETAIGTSPNCETLPKERLWLQPGSFVQILACADTQEHGRTSCNKIIETGHQLNRLMITSFSLL